MNCTMKVKGYGSIEKMEDKRNDRCRKWRLRISLGKDPRSGKYKQATRCFTGTMQEAKEAIKEYYDEICVVGVNTDNKKMTVEQLLNEFIEERSITGVVGQETLDKYETHKNSWCRHFGKLRASALEPRIVTKAMKDLMDGDTPSGKPCSTTYIRSALCTINMAYKWGMSLGYVTKNPIEHVPRPKIDTKEKRAITTAQSDAVIKLLDPTRPIDAIIMMALRAGYRRQEFVNSFWHHINLLDGLAVVPGTKNDSSYATIPFLDIVIEFLLAYKEWQREMLADAGLKQDDDTPLFCNPRTGESYTADAIDKMYRQRRDELNKMLPKELEIGDISLHELRHSFSTWLARNNLHPSVIQKLMRHKDERMALRTYTHVNVADTKSALDSIE